MNLPRIYAEFISNRKGLSARPGRIERHHIVPKCMGGGNEAENLVFLTPSEHLFAHHLLARIHGGVLVSAFIRMTGMKRYSGRKSRLDFAVLRAAHADNVGRASRLSWSDPEQRAYRLAALRRPDVRARKSESAKERWSDPEQRAAQKSKLDAKWNDPEFREAHKNAMNAPEQIANQKRVQSEKWNRTGFRKRMFEAQARPGIKESRRASMQSLHRDPLFLAARDAALSSPEVKARRRESLQKTWDLRRAIRGSG